MYAGYNQYELKGVRIGNWVDEAALLKATGHNRGPRHGEPGYRDTNPRVILHTQKSEPKDYQSCYQATFTDPKDSDKFTPLADHGIREALRRQAVAKRVEEEMAQDKLEETQRRNASWPETVYSEGFVRADRQVYVDNRNAIKPKKLREEALPWEEWEAKSVFDDVATTIYEDAVELGKAHNYTGVGGLDSASGSFGKNTSFTSDIHDPTKGHADPTRDDESLCS